MTERAPMQPLLKISLVDRIVAALRDQIAAGVLEPGSTLRIETLAHEFGVSRTPVREAVSALEAQGLVVRQTGHAPTVFFPQGQEVREWYEMRQVLEPLAGRLALPKVTDAAVDALASLVDSMDDLTVPDWYGLNRDFHEGLYHLAGRPFLLETIDNLIRRADPYMRMYFGSYDLEETQRGHRKILDGVRRRDEAALREAIDSHLDHVLKRILEIIDRGPG
jgi:DNA-binding GntR family transcriptional regulator